jgi:hypothetical protein
LSDNTPQVVIDGRAYAIDQLPDQAKQLVIMVNAAQAELNRLQALTAITNTALQAYTNSLRNAVSNTQPTEPSAHE